MIDQVAGTYYDLAQQDLDGEQMTRSMLIAYREKLRLARGLYEEQNQPAPPELDAVIHHLSNITAVHAGANQT